MEHSEVDIQKTEVKTRFTVTFNLEEGSVELKVKKEIVPQSEAENHTVGF